MSPQHHLRTATGAPNPLHLCSIVAQGPQRRDGPSHHSSQRTTDLINTIVRRLWYWTRARLEIAERALQGSALEVHCTLYPKPLGSNRQSWDAILVVIIAA